MMTNDDLDRRFLLHIIDEIAKYANKHGMEIDDTIGKIADCLLLLLQVSTFNNLKGDLDVNEVSD